MTTTLSSKGQVVLPRLARSKLRLSPGAKLTCEVQGDSIVLKPQSPRISTRELVVDEITGLKVTKRSGTDPLVTSDMVRALMADFP
jgi:AbrB family looped-hinge helix DNA binding protein